MKDMDRSVQYLFLKVEGFYVHTLIYTSVSALVDEAIDSIALTIKNMELLKKAIKNLKQNEYYKGPILVGEYKRLLGVLDQETGRYKKAFNLSRIRRNACFYASRVIKN